MLCKLKMGSSVHSILKRVKCKISYILKFSSCLYLLDEDCFLIRWKITEN